jgi:hypothetical protein
MTLDLEGLRLTKQSPRGKDRVDLQHIEAALRAIQGRVSERVAAMSRRDFVAEAPPSNDSIEFKVEEVSAPSPDAETRTSGESDRRKGAGARNGTRRSL